MASGGGGQAFPTLSPPNQGVSSTVPPVLVCFLMGAPPQLAMIKFRQSRIHLKFPSVLGPASRAYLSAECSASRFIFLQALDAIGLNLLISVRKQPQGTPRYSSVTGSSLFTIICSLKIQFPVHSSVHAFRSCLDLSHFDVLTQPLPD